MLGLLLEGRCCRGSAGFSGFWGTWGVFLCS
jgi:hypothetical protein